MEKNINKVDDVISINMSWYSRLRRKGVIKIVFRQGAVLRKFKNSDRFME